MDKLYVYDTLPTEKEEGDLTLTTNKGDEEEEKTEILVMEAMSRAKRAFMDYWEERGIEGAFFRLQLTTELMDSSFGSVLEKIIWEDKA